LELCLGGGKLTKAPPWRQDCLWPAWFCKAVKLFDQWKVKDNTKTWKAVCKVCVSSFFWKNHGCIPWQCCWRRSDGMISFELPGKTRLVSKDQKRGVNLYLEVSFQLMFLRASHVYLGESQLPSDPGCVSLPYLPFNALNYLSA